MWISEQQKRPAARGEGVMGTVTSGGSSMSVQVESELRGVELYGPAGYHWVPTAGQRVLVIKGEGETPCVVGAKAGGTPREVTISAGTLKLNGNILINGVPLEQYVRSLI